MYCAICGDGRREHLLTPVRFWDPDDGWRIGRLCYACEPEALRRRPHPDDYAWDQRDEYVADLDEAIDVLYG